VDFDTVIQALTPVLAAEPDYANDQARSMLYMGLVKRGDMRVGIGDFTGALEDYQQALAWDEADSMDAASRRDDILEKLGVTPQLETPQPLETSTPPVYQYVAPTIIGPEHDAVFRGEFTVITLQWEAVGALAEDEYYDVTVMHYVAEEPRYWGGPASETQWQVPVEAGLGEAANDRFLWWVTVRRANSGSSLGEIDRALSPPSKTHAFYWAK
jgi:hypothetical protein